MDGLMEGLFFLEGFFSFLRAFSHLPMHWAIRMFFSRSKLGKPGQLAGASYLLLTLQYLLTDLRWVDEVRSSSVDQFSR